MTGSNSFGLLAYLVGTSLPGDATPGAPHVAILVRMVLRCRTMEAVNGARDHLRCLGPSMPGCPSRQLSKMKSDWGYLGEKG
jgi:hypothetical protein